MDPGEECTIVLKKATMCISYSELGQISVTVARFSVSIQFSACSAFLIPRALIHELKMSHIQSDPVVLNTLGKSCVLFSCESTSVPRTTTMPRNM